MQITFNVNGNSQTVDVAPDTPLLWVLRDTLGLTGTKFGCGKALCGACTVHLNGMAVRSCQTPVGSVAGQKVTTIEGLNNNAVQKAWVALDVPQCGYCQPGQMMQATALLATNRNPSDADIDNTVLSTIKYFREEYEAHIRDKKCPAGVCKPLYYYEIDPEKCTGCGVCRKRCPAAAVEGEKKKPHTIHQELCIKCMECYRNCKFDSIKIM